MGRSSNAHNFLIFRWNALKFSPNAHNMMKIFTEARKASMERFEIFTICRRPPVLQTDASVGMMKIVVRETEARKASGRRTSTPR